MTYRGLASPSVINGSSEKFEVAVGIHVLVLTFNSHSFWLYGYNLRVASILQVIILWDLLYVLDQMLP